MPSILDMVFLSENSEFADAVVAAGLCFVGPDGAALNTFGDKAKARALAESIGVSSACRSV